MFLMRCPRRTCWLKIWSRRQIPSRRALMRKKPGWLWAADDAESTSSYEDISMPGRSRGLCDGYGLVAGSAAGRASSARYGVTENGHGRWAGHGRPGAAGRLVEKL